MTQPITGSVQDYYQKQIHGIAEGILGKVLVANGLPITPKRGSELAPIPVYEEDCKESLLTIANIRAQTRLQWVAMPSVYLQAYYKRYRGENGRMRNDIVVIAGNYCWSRFYAAKELMHCFLDEDGYGASGSIEAVNTLIESLATNGFARPDCTPQTAVDEVAWNGAVLYLLPDSWLPVIRTLQQELEAEFKDGNSYQYLAQLLRVPELLVRHRLR